MASIESILYQIEETKAEIEGNVQELADRLA